MLTHYVCKDDVLKAEMLWVLKVIESHFSYNSTQKIVYLLKMILPDSKIGEIMSWFDKMRILNCPWTCTFLS